MKKFLEPKKLIGPAIRKMGMEQNLTLYELKEHLAVSLQAYFNVQDTNRDGRGNKGKVQYGEETVNGYLYGRSWPQIPPEETIKIVCEAFKNALETKGESFNPELKQKISETIFSIFSNYEKEKGTRYTNYFMIHSIPLNLEYGKFLLKHWDACSGLTSDEIELWDIISTWTEDKRKKYLKMWSNKKLVLEASNLVQSVTSPAFYQWLIMRNKDYSEQDRKSKATPLKIPKESEQDREDKLTPLKIPKEVAKKLYDLTDAQRDSLNAIQIHMEVNAGRIHKKHKLCLPSEIDLILLFKYFLSDTQKAAILEDARNNKAADDD